MFKKPIDRPRARSLRATSTNPLEDDGAQWDSSTHLTRRRHMAGTICTLHDFVSRRPIRKQLQMRSDRLHHLDAYQKWIEEYVSHIRYANRRVLLEWSARLISEGLSLSRAVKYMTILRTLDRLIQLPLYSGNGARHQSTSDAG